VRVVCDDGETRRDAARATVTVLLREGTVVARAGFRVADKRVVNEFHVVGLARPECVLCVDWSIAESDVAEPLLAKVSNEIF